MFSLLDRSGDDQVGFGLCLEQHAAGVDVHLGVSWAGIGKAADTDGDVSHEPRDQRLADRLVLFLATGLAGFHQMSGAAERLHQIPADSQDLFQRDHRAQVFLAVRLALLPALASIGVDQCPQGVEVGAAVR